MALDVLYLAVHKALEQAFLLAVVKLVKDHTNQCLVLRSTANKSLSDDLERQEGGGFQSAKSNDSQSFPLDGGRGFGCSDLTYSCDERDDSPVKNEVQDTNDDFNVGNHATIFPFVRLVRLKDEAKDALKVSLKQELDFDRTREAAVDDSYTDPEKVKTENLNDSNGHSAETRDNEIPQRNVNQLSSLPMASRKKENTKRARLVQKTNLDRDSDKTELKRCPSQTRVDGKSLNCQSDGKRRSQVGEDDNLRVTPAVKKRLRRAKTLKRVEWYTCFVCDYASYSTPENSRSTVHL